MKIGVISDTHGLLRPEAIAALAGVEQIIHAGDIGSPEVLSGLAEIAPVTAVVGNIDHGQSWAEEIPAQQRLELAGVPILLLHDAAQLAGELCNETVQLVISGHSHRPSWQQQDGVNWLNPGSAGRRRFSLPVCLALVELNRVGVEVTFVELLSG